MYITREDAVKCLYELINSDILAEDLIWQIQEIAICIEHESEGYHVWGAEEEAADLFSVPRSDLIKDEVMKERKKLIEKYSFAPAPYEAEVD